MLVTKAIDLSDEMKTQSRATAEPWWIRSVNKRPGWSTEWDPEQAPKQHSCHNFIDKSELAERQTLPCPDCPRSVEPMQLMSAGAAVLGGSDAIAKVNPTSLLPAQLGTVCNWQGMLGILSLTAETQACTRSPVIACERS